MNSKGSVWMNSLFVVSLVATGVGFYQYYQTHRDVVVKQAELDQRAEELATYRKKITELEDKTQKIETEKKALEPKVQQGVKAIAAEEGYKKQIAALQQDLQNAKSGQETQLQAVKNMC